MSEKIEETQAKLKNLGYLASEDLAKIVYLFEATGKKDRKNIPTLLLQGKSGVGKTFLGETFSKMIGADKKFVQCFPRMGTENFQYDVNIEGVMKQDADTSIKPGILLQALQQSQKSPVVLVLDELDKARPEVDSFLLDFLENGRLTTGTDTYEKGNFPIYTFITSNDKRELDEALINRCKKVEVPRPTKELFLEILNLPEDHYLGSIYDKCPNFSIRQAREYLLDLETLEMPFDADALSQYINFDELDIKSVADLQYLEDLENNGLEVDLPDLETCQINLNDLDSELVPLWINLLKNSGEKFDFESKVGNYCKKEDLHINIKTTDQLKLLKNYGLSEMDYSGWFAHELSDKDMETGNIIWAGNKSKKDGTRFGIKIDGDIMFRIAMNRGSTFVYLNSSSDKNLENFLGKEMNKTEQEYKTDSKYNDNGRD